MDKERIEVLIEDINSHSTHPIKNKYELSLIFENIFSGNKQEDFKDLIFSAKYVNGLKKVLADKIINKDKYLERMFDEFNKNLQKVMELMKIVTEGLSESESKFFDEKYFIMDQQSIVNTMDIIEDFSLCKEYFNSFPNAVPGLTFRHS